MAPARRAQHSTLRPTAKWRLRAAVTGAPKIVTDLSGIVDLFDVLPDTVIVVDGRGRIVFANRAAKGLLGYAPVDLVGRSLDLLVPPDARAHHREMAARFRKGGKPGPMGRRPLLSAVGRSGAEVPVSISIANVALRGGRYTVAVLRSAATVRQQLSAARTQASTDALTGLANRAHLSECLRESIREGKPFGLLFMDLRHFKRLNDGYGHEVGDEVLRFVAKRIGALIRPRDTAVRFGGDEFVVLLHGVGDPALLASRAAGLAQSIERPFRVGGLTDSIGVNVGGAIYPRDGAGEKRLLAVADRNMYRAKRMEVACVVDPSPKSRSSTRRAARGT